MVMMVVVIVVVWTNRPLYQDCVRMDKLGLVMMVVLMVMV